MNAAPLEKSPQSVSLFASPRSAVHMNQPTDRHQLPIRRNKDEHMWMIADGIRNDFIARFEVGFLEDVKFVHTAKPMSCVPGYHSTGEVIGDLTVLKKSWWRKPSMPAGIFSQEIIYDASRHIFRLVSDYSPVDSADCLLLLKNGCAIVGWKE